MQQLQNRFLSYHDENIQSMHLAPTMEVLSPVLSLEQIEIIIRLQFEHFGRRLDACFFSSSAFESGIDTSKMAREQFA